jgi:transposase-like protein
MECYQQFYPTAGTVFEKTTTPLTYWFYAMYLMSVTRNGVAAKELERALGISYKCAWRMARQIRILMAANDVDKLFGEVQVDETYVGRRTEGKSGRNNKEKAPVIAMVETKGRVFAKSVANVKKETMFPEIESRIDKSATIYTDEFPVYTNLHQLGYNHETVMHKIKEYSRGRVTTNAAEGFFSQLKRMISGSHIWVSKKHLELYVKECTFRYNNRTEPGKMFERILLNLCLDNATNQKKAS